MDNKQEFPIDGFLGRMILASAGSYKHYIISICGQTIFGLLYSTGLFDVAIAGLLLGFVMPTIWIILTYRLVLQKSRNNILLPFPAWILKNPGNTILIITDIVFLAAIWTIILSGLYNPAWIKVVFTIFLPILTLSMLRTMIVFPFHENDSPKQNGKKTS